LLIRDPCCSRPKRRSTLMQRSMLNVKDAILMDAIRSIWLVAVEQR
jgi:hypothetical protein